MCICGSPEVGPLLKERLPQSHNPLYYATSVQKGHSAYDLFKVDRNSGASCMASQRSALNKKARRIARVRRTVLFCASADPPHASVVRCSVKGMQSGTSWNQKCLCPARRCSADLR